MPLQYPERYPSVPFRNQLCLHSRKRACKRLVTHPLFNPAVTVLILLNTLLMCLYYYGMPLWLCRMIDGASVAFTIVFTLEVAVKLAGLGLRR
eukprot:6214810-Pleurochrysis_carterae.AAC.10